GLVDGPKGPSGLAWPLGACHPRIDCRGLNRWQAAAPLRPPIRGFRCNGGCSARAARHTTRTTMKPSKRHLMRKPEPAAAIAEKADLSREQATRVLNAALQGTTDALHRKDSVTLVGFGTFVQRHRGARTGKNPQTGEPVKIKASNTVAFKPGKSLRDAIN